MPEERTTGGAPNTETPAGGAPAAETTTQVQPGAAATTETKPVPDTTVRPVYKPEDTTREWLRSIGVAVQDIRPRTEPTIGTTDRPVRPTTTETRRSRDVEVLKDVLKSGTDEDFIEGLLEAGTRRARQAVESQRTDMALGEQINDFVSKHAPELPLVVFWAFAGDAERRFPGQLDRQIDWAIQQGTSAMDLHNTRIADRTRERDASDIESDTLEGTPAGGGTRRRSNTRRNRPQDEDEPEESMVQTIINAQRQKLGG